MREAPLLFRGVRYIRFYDFHFCKIIRERLIMSLYEFWL
jgi:hypothetical protein